MAGKSRPGSLNAIGKDFRIRMPYEWEEEIKSQPDYVSNRTNRWAGPSGVSGWVRELVRAELDRRRATEEQPE